MAKRKRSSEQKARERRKKRKDDLLTCTETCRETKETCDTKLEEVERDRSNNSLHSEEQTINKTSEQHTNTESINIPVELKSDKVKLSDKDINPSSKEKMNHSSSRVKILTPSAKHQMEKTKSSTSGELKSDYLKVTHQQLSAKDIDLLLVGKNDSASINEVKTKRVIRESQIDNENRLTSAELQIKVQVAPDQLNVREKIASSKGEKSLSSTCVNGRSTVIPNRQERDNLIKMQNSSRQKIMHDSLKNGKGNHHDHEAAMLRRLSMEFANQSSLANSLNLNSTRSKVQQSLSRQAAVSQPPHTQKQIINRQSYNPQLISNLVGTKGVFIPDDVITASVCLLRNQDTNDLFTIGDFTPAAQQIALQNPGQQYFLDDDKIAINFLLIQQHWMTVIFNPMTRNIHLFDSLRNNNRPRQVLPLLRPMYGNRISLSDIIYPTVVQQPFDDPSCGAFAIAFAFSYIFGKQPEK